MSFLGRHKKTTKGANEMATHDLGDDEFREAYKNNDIVVLDFWAPWCGPCHQFAPIYEEASEKYAQMFFGKVNTEEQVDLAQYFGVRSIPTTLVIREGIEVFRGSGVLGSEQLEQLLQQVQNLDMEDVKKKVEEEEQQQGDL